MPIKQRTILWYLVFMGFSVNYMQRCNLNIAIIDMIDSTHLKILATSNASSECLVNTEKNSSNENIDKNFASKQQRSFYSPERHLLNLLSVISYSIFYENECFLS